MLKFLLPILLLQIASGADDSCPTEVVVTERVTDPEQLVGNWSVVYIWNNVVSSDSRAKSLCLNSTISGVAQTEVDLMKLICHDHVDFDWDNVKLKLSVRFMPSRLISTDGEFFYILEFCSAVIKAEVRQTSNGYKLITFPGMGNYTELIAAEVPTKDDLVCLAENVDVTQNMSGFPVCFK